MPKEIDFGETIFWRAKHYMRRKEIGP
jgi:hypothetical protein